MGVSLRSVTKPYGATQVLQPTDLDVGEGEFLTILGPSGSGKTTILRMVGGFTAPTSGRILFGAEDINDVPTHRRPFNTVFQDYALFPHMTVAENVAYGLRVRGMPRQAARARASETLEMVGLGGLSDRKPAQLSGGQRQRVALARAIVCEPKLILLDEPLSALDAGLRRQMQGFLKDLQRRLATTFLFVTHDQEEAITMSDRIVVMSNGRIEQIGTPKELYYAPKTAFAARFFGDNNLLPGRIEGGRLHCGLGEIALPSAVAAAPSRPVLATLRPECIRLGGGPQQTVARLTDAVFAGAVTHPGVRTADGTGLTLKLTSNQGAPLPATGSEVVLGFDPFDIAVLETAA